MTVPTADKPVRHILTISGDNAASYVRALDMLGPILTRHYPKPIVGGSMRHSFSLADIHAFKVGDSIYRQVYRALKCYNATEKVTDKPRGL
ncbi:MAG: hypothetical protein IKJ89_00130 [Kiritimatiellae bacterium]|nr:hypothetical protein [Kiritimatiellia bacterium]